MRNGLFDLDEPLKNEADPSNKVLNALLAQAHQRLDPSLRRIHRERVAVGVTETTVAPLLIVQGERGLMAVRFLDIGDQTTFLNKLREQFDLEKDDAMAATIGKEIEALMHGDASAIDSRPVDLRLVESDFQRRALRRLRTIPAGALTSYQALAAAAGSPSAQRAIGNTVASNPIAIYVPCHRVIKSDGSIGNYGGGVERKLALLRAEGFRPNDDRRIPSEAVYGHQGTRIFCRPTCRAAMRARRDRMLIYPGVQGATKAGLRPCKLCHPEQAA
ncbi:MAG TPA: methylated-DNA--[protein]-cysteine S-methyltransferase [Candidatus Binataceae bacterium]|nr:methylated-DNA--[protein]-cysteine S-methyltransferase [Candidatus Binataceae bacterium]